MKGLKLISGAILIFVIFLLIPRGHCADSVKDTVFLEPIEMTNFYNIQTSEGDIVKWSFQTYNDSFPVYAFALTLYGVISSGKTSDSGSIEALITGSITFYFQNAGSTSGYIDITIRVKKDIIEGYYPLIIILILIPLISIVSIKKRYSLKR